MVHIKLSEEESETVTELVNETEDDTTAEVLKTALQRYYDDYQDYKSESAER